MYALFQPDFYNTVCAVMLAMAVVVFIGLHRITAGYGVAYSMSRPCPAAWAKRIS